MKRLTFSIKPGSSVEDPRIAALAVKHILHLANAEDVSGPAASGLKADDYIAELAIQLRAPISLELKTAGMVVSSERLSRICHVAGSETYVIRRLKEAVDRYQISREDICHLPFYKSYRHYFEQGR